MSENKNIKKIICLGDTMHEVRLALDIADHALKLAEIPFKHNKYKNELIIYDSIKIIGISSRDIPKIKDYTHKKVEAFNAGAFLMIQDPTEQLKVILGG